MSQQMFALSLGLVGMLAAADIAHGAPQCDRRDRAVGIAGEAAVMELYAADASGTWSIT